MRISAIELSLGALAAAFGLSRDVLRRIVAEAGVAPSGKRGGHPTYRLRDVYLAVTGQQKPETMNPHARLALARAELTEDEIRQRRGELVAATDVESTIGRLCKILVQHLDTLPDVLERDVGATPLQLRHIERAIDKTRDDIFHAVIASDKGGDDDEAGRESSH